jgi:hypothetical protein
MSGYIGTQPVPQATQTRDSFTATSGQTTFATGGYTPNFLDVYLNGVKLASADYTASNGSDVVLASGAATGDILEVVAFTTFTPASIPDGTPSIDDNGNATAITIDSNENVLVGTTSMTASDTSGTGMMYANGVALRVKRESSGGGQPCLDLNNTGSDDVMAMFRKDGVTVGSIGTQGSRLSIGSGDVNLNFNASANSMYPISDPAAGTLSSGIVDLGAALATFKDAYLSGGVYLGGTGSANKLEDYEEGSWTPTATNGGSFSNSAYGSYTKIGNVVTLHATLIVSSNSSGLGFGITSLPFAQSSSNTEAAAGFYMRYTTDSTLRMVYLSNGSVISVYNIGGGATTFGTASTKRYDFSGVYYTDA